MTKWMDREPWRHLIKGVDELIVMMLCQIVWVSTLPSSIAEPQQVIIYAGAWFLWWMSAVQLALSALLFAITLFQPCRAELERVNKE